MGPEVRALFRGGGLRPSLGCGGEGGIAPLLVSYLCMVGAVGAANWGGSTRTTWVAPMDGRVPWAGGVGLTRGL